MQTSWKYPGKEKKIRDVTSRGEKASRVRGQSRHVCGVGGFITLLHSSRIATHYSQYAWRRHRKFPW
jgi:hypothetical protein